LFFIIFRSCERNGYFLRITGRDGYFLEQHEEIGISKIRRENKGISLRISKENRY